MASPVYRALSCVHERPSTSSRNRSMPGSLQYGADFMTRRRIGVVQEVARSDKRHLETGETDFAGLVPIMIGTDTGSEGAKRIAAPMVGSTITAPWLSMFVAPAVYFLLRRRKLRKATAVLVGKEATDELF